MITISTKYALKALLFLANSDRDTYISIDTLSNKAGVPRPYLAKIMKDLAKKDLIISKKGLNGGFKIEKGTHINLYDVCVALDDPAIKQSCFLGKHLCASQGTCPVHDRWATLRNQISKFLTQYKVA